MLNRIIGSNTSISRFLVMGTKREMSTTSNDNGSESESKSSSEFDLHLQKEIELAKIQQTIKNNNKKLKKNGNNDELRDVSGFKLKVSQTNDLKNKQVDPEYDVVIDGSLRKILPYYFTYKTFCKLRWRDRKLVDVFLSEFRDREPSYYIKTIAAGKVFLNNEPANLDSVIRNGELITHKVHRHEPPVPSRPIKTVFENDDLLVIDKPSGMPVHPTGRFRFNTVTKSIEKQYGYIVHPCNRLDKLTSGLMFLAKSSKGADEMADQLKAREVTKEYVARVVGKFPINETIVEKPVRSIDPRVSLNAVCSMEDENAKHARTIFNRVSYDGDTSIVRCKPLTGRTHQIRVHLQYLGFPIANDPIYSNPQVWGPTLGKQGEADFQDVVSKLNEIGKYSAAESWMYSNAAGEILSGKKCEECETNLYTDPGPNDLNLWLHAYRYESTELDEDKKRKWSYRTEFPEWALNPHRKYMEMALEKAKECEETTTAYSVGAVLVNGTEILSTGFSRELPGNTHAEQCALEKYFEKVGKREVPEGTVLYTTIEPCSFRLSGNDPCLTRILNLNGNIETVFVGILEPDTFVKNNTSLQTLLANGIDYVKIPGYEDACIEAARKGHEEKLE